MFNGPKAENIENWECVLERSTDIEVQMAKNYLSSLNIPSNVLSKRDSAYSLTVGEMALVYLYVPKDYAEEAREALKDWDYAEDPEPEDDNDKSKEE